MKKKLLFLCFFIAVFLKMQAQTTYYWKGATGATATPTDWQVATNWNTESNGTGSNRTLIAADDILIFDGSATTTTTSYVGNIPTEIIGTLKLTGAAQVHMVSAVTQSLINEPITLIGDYGGYSPHPVRELSGTNFTANLKVGDFIYSTTNNLLSGQVLAIKDNSTIAVSTDKGLTTAASYTKYTTLYTNKLLIDALSSLNFGSGATPSAFALITKGGEISGSVYFGTYSGLNRLFCTVPNRGNSTDGLRFLSGGSFTFSGVGNNTNLKKQHPLGHTLGLYSGSGSFIYNDGSGNNNTKPGYTGEAGIVFEAGSSYRSISGDPYTPFGISALANNSVLYFTPAVAFKTGSKFVQTSWVGSAVYRINKNTTTLYFLMGSIVSYPDLELTSAFPNSGDNVEFESVGNLTLSGTVALPRNGTMVVKGNISNTTAATINLSSVYLAGATNQNISGTAPLTFGNLYIADKAIVTLSSNINATNVHLLGKLNFGSNTITGTGTFNTYGTYSKTATSNFTKGSSTVGGITSTSNFATAPYTYEFPIGSSVVNSTYIEPNTVYKSYTSSGNGVMSTTSIGTTATGETVTFSIAGSSYTTSSPDLASATPGFATRFLDINGATVLPLDLLSLSGSNANNNVNLIWITANEVNLRRFEIEKRIGNEFVKIATKSAQNLSKGAQYNFVDDISILSLHNYYRLKMIDFDGSYKYSDVVVVTIPNLTASALTLTAYPNPTTDKITILHPSANFGTKLSALSIDGRNVLIKTIDANTTQTTLDVSSLPNGIYMLIYNNKNQIDRLRFVKQ